MRAWRKIYSKLLESEQVAGLSDGAFRLFTLLIVAQDDTGYYPWTPTMVRRLTLSTSWSIQQADQYADALVTAGLCIRQDNGMTLISAMEYNGPPKDHAHTNWRLPDLYHRPIATVSVGQESDKSRTGVGQESDKSRTRGEERRGEESREEYRTASRSLWKPGIKLETIQEWREALTFETSKTSRRNIIGLLAEAHSCFHGLRLDPKAMSKLCGRLGKMLIGMKESPESKANPQTILDLSYRASTEAAGEPLDWMAGALRAAQGRRGSEGNEAGLSRILADKADADRRRQAPQVP